MYGRRNPYGGGMRGQGQRGRRPGFGQPGMMPGHPGMTGHEGGMPDMGGHGGMVPGIGEHSGIPPGMGGGMGRGGFGGIGYSGTVMGYPGMGHRPACPNQLRMLNTMRMLEEMDYDSDSEEYDYPHMPGFGRPPPGKGGMSGFGRHHGGRF
jgi:hypothetical protein